MTWDYRDAGIVFLDEKPFLTMVYTLITGASSGIGRELAILFASKGHSLVLIARNREKLEFLETTLKETYQIEVLPLVVDLAQPGAADKILQFIRKRQILINYLVNNAGFYIKNDFYKIHWEKEKDLIQIQCMTHTELTKGVLPMMLEHKKGGIMNIASTGSFVPGPYNAIYCAVKAFVLSFSEALSEELRGSGVSVTAVCPGGTETSFQDFSNRKKSLLNKPMKASFVAREGYRGLMKGRRLVIPGIFNRMQVIIAQILPRNLVVRLTAKMV